MSFVGGEVVLSDCGNRINIVERYNASDGRIAEDDNTAEVAYYRCYFLATDGDQGVDNKWTIGQLARCETNNITRPGSYSNYENSNYWRLVINVSKEPKEISGKKYHWFDLSNSASKSIELTDAGGTKHVVEIGGYDTTKEHRACRERQRCRYGPSVGHRQAGRDHNIGKRMDCVSRNRPLRSAA